MAKPPFQWSAPNIWSHLWPSFSPPFTSKRSKIDPELPPFTASPPSAWRKSPRPLAGPIAVDLLTHVPSSLLSSVLAWQPLHIRHLPPPGTGHCFTTAVLSAGTFFPSAVYVPISSLSSGLSSDVILSVRSLSSPLKNSALREASNTVGGNAN